MQHPEFIERLKSMTPAQRIKLGLDLTDSAWAFLRTLPPEEAQRRLDIAHGQPWNPPDRPEGDE